jgi:hypothetical protein
MESEEEGEGTALCIDCTFTKLNKRLALLHGLSRERIKYEEIWNIKRPNLVK